MLNSIVLNRKRRILMGRSRHSYFEYYYSNFYSASVIKLMIIFIIRIEQGI